MSIHRRAAKVDINQGDIVDAIRAEGWDCEIIRRPCDVICWHPVLDVLQWGEIKEPSKVTKAGQPVADSRMDEQRKFLAWTSCPIWTTPQEAIADLRKHYPSDAATPDLIAYARRIKDDFEREWKRDGKAPGAAQRVAA